MKDIIDLLDRTGQRATMRQHARKIMKEKDYHYVIPRAICAIVAVACLMYWGGVWLLGCAANAPHVQNEIEATQAGGDYGACTAKVLADGGTQRDWQKCACEVDAFHHVDSGKCAP